MLMRAKSEYRNLQAISRDPRNVGTSKPWTSAMASAPTTMVYNIS